MDIERYRDLPEKWRDHLREWIDDEFTEDTPVVLYEHDGTDTPLVFEPYAHIAVTVDPKLCGIGDASVIWPVDYEGWADIRQLGWSGILPLLREGRRV